MPYIILDLERSRPDNPVFWRAEDTGYTSNPFRAGLYDNEVIYDSWNFYNSRDTVAIPITPEGLELIDFKISFDTEKAANLRGRPKPEAK